MNIALLGYGKMGRIIEEIAERRGHHIVARVSSQSGFQQAHTADVAIEFSSPEAAVGHLSWAFEQQLPVVCGTTGWLEQYDTMAQAAQQAETAFLYASNFSLGVNLFFEMARRVGALMAQQPDYTLELEEVHHIHKKDAPSGTAITLAEQLMDVAPQYHAWTLGKPGPHDIPIKALREPEVPGTHSLYYRSAIDTIELRHTAHSREGFALGAVLAAEWLQGKKGVFGMRDVLGL